jgi:hypothetical protein
MELLRLHAYSIVPQRTLDETVPSTGGAIKPTAELRTVMEESEKAAKFEKQPLVEFIVDQTTRTNEIRNAIIAFAFGEIAQAKAAAVLLAQRLSTSMDERSTPCLFMPTAYRNGEQARVVLWVFPQDGAFQLRVNRHSPSIDILKNIFSQTSRLRRAAAFEGRNLRTEYLSGRVLDHQAGSSTQDVANFWVSRFLQCSPSLRKEAGTRMLAKVVQKAYETCSDQNGKEQIQTAIMAMRQSPHKRISLEAFAKNYLEGEAKEAFLDATPNSQTRATFFDFERQTFDDVLQFCVFQLNTGVYVSTPPSEIGSSVHISGQAEKKLVCEGIIIDDKIRMRHA